ncbi:MAG: cupin domain-containing protein [Planctomycetota bacterium]|jgi:mannose-6-phosphate isomerase-like protein (cupin superfamily)
MICRYYEEGEKLNVADLNLITVLIDRSETELTEVALNEWKTGLNGPPHRHGQKEQIFFVVSGAGDITVGGETFAGKPKDMFYVPSGVTHQTNSTGAEPLQYLLFNAFSNSDKEGHATFAEHIAKVKDTRRKQADTQQADVTEVEGAAQTKKGKFVSGISAGKRFDAGGGSGVLLLERSEAERCEASVVTMAAGNKGPSTTHQDQEQTWFVLSGRGSVTVGDETEAVKAGNVVFVPRNTQHTAEAGQEGLTYLCLATLVTQGK